MGNLRHYKAQRSRLHRLLINSSIIPAPPILNRPPFPRTVSLNSSTIPAPVNTAGLRGGRKHLCREQQLSKHGRASGGTAWWHCLVTAQEGKEEVRPTGQGMHKVGFKLLESSFLLGDITLANAGLAKFPYSTL